jgi:hypothetical protein
MPDAIGKLEGALSGTLEENVVTALAWDDDLCPLIAARLEPSIFSTRIYREIAKKSLEYFERFGRPPRAHLTDLLEHEVRRGEAGKLIRETVDRIQALGPELQSQFVIESLDHFIELRKLMLKVEEATDRLHANDLSGAKELLHRADETTEFTPGIFLHDDRNSMAFLDRAEEDIFSTGIEALDRAGIRPARKTVTMLLGTIKSGKSWFLIGCGKAALLHRRSVLHVSLENSEQLTARRYMQALFGMTARKGEEFRRLYFQKNERGDFLRWVWDADAVYAEGLEEVERKRLAQRVRALRRRPPLLIKEFPTNQLTITKLSMFLNMLDRIYDFRPDMLIVDYPDLMDIDPDNLRIMIGRTVQGIRGLCGQRNMAGVIVSQGNRGSFNATAVHAGMVAEDYSKLGTADTILAYSQTQPERDRGLARISVEGAREGLDKFVVLITQQYATGQFCLDSVRMNRVAEVESRKVIDANKKKKPDDDEDC